MESGFGGARESEGSRVAREAFRTTADAIIEDLTVRCLAYNVAQKYSSIHQEVLANGTLQRWGDLMNLSRNTIEQAKVAWRKIVTSYNHTEQ